MRQKQKWLSLLLTVLLVIGLLPSGVMAAESETHEHNMDGWVCTFTEAAPVLTCEQEEHIHDDSCRDEAGNTVCIAKEEHIHNDVCYVSNGEWNCAAPETNTEQTDEIAGETTDENVAAVNRAAAQAGSVIYMSQSGSGNCDGSTAENAMRVDKIGSLMGDVEVQVVGTITLPEDMPAANITFCGADEDATVKTQNYVSFNGDTIFSSLNYDSNNFTYMFADGYDLTFTESVNATATGLKIFGGGKQRDVEGNPTITVKTSMEGADIFGGGWTGKLTGDPTINISGATLSNVYGGGYARGKSADVVGSPTINLESCSFTGTNYIVGGGFVELSSGITANVSGTVTIKADNLVMNISGDLYLGSRVMTSGSSATISKLDAEISNSTLGKTVFAGSYCAGKNSTADIENVSVQFDKVTVNGDVYAGGYTDDRADSGSYSATVGKSTIDLANSTAKKIFGGGYQKGANVTTSALTVKNIEDVTVFAGGYNGYSTVDSCEINVENASSKGSGFNMVINGGGGNTPAGTLYDTVAALTVNFNGTNTVKTIRAVDNIYIRDGAVLSQLDTNKSLLSDTDPNDNLTIGKDAQLILKGNHAISGDFYSQGNLTNDFRSLLLVGGKVTSDSTASYTSTDFSATYENSYPFLATKADDKNNIAGFLSTNPSYFVNNRTSDTDGFQTNGAQREWYLDAYIYKVDFVENGGTEVQDLSEVLKGTAISEPSTSKDGYTLIGWYKEPTFENPWNFENDTVESDLTLYAKWNAVPEITAKDKTLTVGDKFDPMADVTASDKEDGDLTDKVEILKNEVDTSKVAVYEVTYKVTDTQGASSTKTIYVTVNPKMEALNSIPEITAKDKTLTVGDKFDPMADVTASDKEDGDLTDKVEILKNEVDTSKAAVYEVTYKVTDTQGASSTKTIYVTVNPKMEALNSIPEITAKDKTLTVGDKFDPMADVTASDKEDGDLTDKVEILKNEVDTSKVAVYEVTYKVTDSKGASSTKTIRITVVGRDTEPTTPTASPKPTDPGKENPGTETGGPQTGDDSNIVLWLALLISSSGALTGAILYRRKKKYNS